MDATAIIGPPTNMREGKGVAVNLWMKSDRCRLRRRQWLGRYPEKGTRTVRRGHSTPPPGL